MARAAEIARAEVRLGLARREAVRRPRRGRRVTALASPGPTRPEEGRRIEEVAAVGDAEATLPIFGARGEELPRAQRGPRRVATVGAGRSAGRDRADGLVARRAGDPLHRPRGEEIAHRLPALAVPRGGPRRHLRREVLSGRVAVDAPVLAAGAGHAAALLRLTADVGARAAEDASTVGAEKAPAHLLLDGTLQRAVERALGGERHDGAPPLGDLARVARRAVVGARPLQRPGDRRGHRHLGRGRLPAPPSGRRRRQGDERGAQPRAQREVADHAAARASLSSPRAAVARRAHLAGTARRRSRLRRGHARRRGSPGQRATTRLASRRSSSQRRTMAAASRGRSFGSPSIILSTNPCTPGRSSRASASSNGGTSPAACARSAWRRPPSRNGCVPARSR